MKKKIGLLIYILIIFNINANVYENYQNAKKQFENSRKKSIKKKRPKESDITLLLKRLLPKSKDELHQKIIYDNKEWLTPSEEQSNIITNVLKSKISKFQHLHNARGCKNRTC